MNDEKLIEFGKERRREFDAGVKARSIIHDSVFDDGRIKRLEGMNGKTLAAYTRALVNAHAARMKALMDAPADSVFSKTKKIERKLTTSLSREINVPTIGKLMLDAFVDKRVSAEPQGHTLRLIPGTKRPTALVPDTRNLFDNLVIARQMTPRGGSDYPFVRGESHTVATNAEISDESIESLGPHYIAALEDRVETLGAVCDSAGIEVELVVAEPFC